VLNLEPNLCASKHSKKSARVLTKGERILWKQ